MWIMLKKSVLALSGYSMTYDPIRARQLLVTGIGQPDASFREGQEDAIAHVEEGRGRLLLVQKTGWGKS